MISYLGAFGILIGVGIILLFVKEYYTQKKKIQQASRNTLQTAQSPYHIYGRSANAQRNSTDDFPPSYNQAVGDSGNLAEANPPPYRS